MSVIFMRFSTAVFLKCSLQAWALCLSLIFHILIVANRILAFMVEQDMDYNN